MYACAVLCTVCGPLSLTFDAMILQLNLNSIESCACVHIVNPIATHIPNEWMNDWNLSLDLNRFRLIKISFRFQSHKLAIITLPLFLFYVIRQFPFHRENSKIVIDWKIALNAPNFTCHFVRNRSCFFNETIWQFENCSLIHFHVDQTEPKQHIEQRISFAKGNEYRKTF